MPAIFAHAHQDSGRAPLKKATDEADSPKRGKIIWVSFFYLDALLSKTFVIEILTQLAKLGYDVSLIAVRSKNRFELKNSKVRVIPIPLRYVPIISPLIFSVTLSSFLPIYALTWKPNFILMTSLFEPSIFSLVLTRIFSRFSKPKVKVILDIRSPPLAIAGLRGKFITFCYNVSICLAKALFDGITIMTPLMRKEICEKFSIDPNFVGVWANAASISLFRPEKFSRHGMELRKKFGLSDKFVVFYHGEFSRNRSIIETVDAISITKGKYSNIVLFLLGKGPLTPNLKQMIREKEIQSNVILHDAVDYTDVPKYIAMSNVGVVPLPNSPYWRYQCPTKLLEYLAMKKTVIVTDIPAHREIIGNEKCGIYISSTAPIEIARAIMYAYDNKEKLNEWAESGREIIIKEYNWEKVARDLENYLLRVRNTSGER